MRSFGLRDVLGPIMVGPSSSHTAGALRIAQMARQVLQHREGRAFLELHPRDLLGV